MIGKRQVIGKSEMEIVDIILANPLADTADLIRRLLKEIDELTPPKKITLTQKQFEEHFQISNEVGRRGRPCLNAVKKTQSILRLDAEKMMKSGK